ncbi:MAG: hypothetical protein CMN57_06995 [Gammaproteobacteria bacterium]|nr:hypothetical protein [Gammaproteobacteria bacterium]
MPTSAPDTPQRHRLNVEDYHRMAEAGILGEDARVELIEGEIIDMTPIGSRHAAAVKRLIHILSLGVGDAAIVSAQDPIILDPHSEPQPDLALLRPRADYYAAAHPRPADVLLVIEVADSSLAYDRDIKLPLYARAGIPEAWLVDIEAGSLICFIDPAADGYRHAGVVKELNTVRITALPGLELDLQGLF